MIKYFTPEHTEKEKQIYVSTVGYEEIAPGEEYPSHNHPAGYYFNPAVGRVINEYQIVYFIAGEGTLRLQNESFRISSGSVLMLPPARGTAIIPIRPPDGNSTGSGSRENLWTNGSGSLSTTARALCSG